MQPSKVIDSQVPAQVDF